MLLLLSVWMPVCLFMDVSGYQRGGFYTIGCLEKCQVGIEIQERNVKFGHKKRI